MRLFKKLPEKISISGTDYGSFELFYKQIKAMKLKNTSVTSLARNDDACQFSIKCNDADTIYSTVVLPLVYKCDNPNHFEIIIEFEDKSGKAKCYPQEILASFRLDSAQALGDKIEQDFIHKLKEAITVDTEITQAAVAYMIISGGAVTISIPCAEPEKVNDMLVASFKSHDVTLYDINTISREPCIHPRSAPPTSAVFLSL